MQNNVLIRRLSALSEPEGTLVTLSLDLSGPGPMPPATRHFLRGPLLENLESTTRPEEVRLALRKIARRISAAVEEGIRPASKGVFMLAGRRTWEQVGTRVPLPNFVHAGAKPCLAPLLEAQARAPRAYGVRLDPHLARIVEADLEGLRDRARLEGDGIGHDRERLASGLGGAAMDHFQRHANEVVNHLATRAAAAVGEMHAAAPAEAVVFMGARERFTAFRDHLGSTLRARAVYGGAPPRDESEILSRIAGEAERRAGERRELEIGEFLDRRGWSDQVALGPREVMEHLREGRLSRVFLHADDPMPGLACPNCGSVYAALENRCRYCGGALKITSMLGEVIAYGMTHPPLPVTFVPRPAPWLEELGGMTALVSPTGVKRKIVRVHA